MKAIGKCEVCGGKIIQAGNGNILLKEKLQVAEKALNDILVWQEDTSEDWEYPETIASKALEKLAKIDGF